MTEDYCGDASCHLCSEPVHGNVRESAQSPIADDQVERIFREQIKAEIRELNYLMSGSAHPELADIAHHRINWLLERLEQE